MSAASQLGLFDRPARGVEDSFDRWLADNPHIVRAFVRLALQQVRAGRKRVGAKRIVEQLRYDTSLAERGGDGWKINNTMTSRLARHAVSVCPELAGVFEFRGGANV